MGMYDNAPAGFDNPQRFTSENEASSSSDIAQGFFGEPGSVEWLKYMANQDDAYAEKYFDYMVDQANLASAQSYDKWVRSHNYQMMAEDLKNAGMNPYLALNSLGGSSGSNLQASNNTSNATSVKNQKDLGKSKILALLLASILSSGARLIPALIG